MIMTTYSVTDFSQFRRLIISFDEDIEKYLTYLPLPKLLNDTMVGILCLSGFIILISITGLANNRTWLYIYISLTSILALASVVLLVTIFVKMENLKKTLINYVEEYLMNIYEGSSFLFVNKQFLKSKHNISIAIDKIQINYQCCGVLNGNIYSFYHERFKKWNNTVAITLNYLSNLSGIYDVQVQVYF